MFGGYYSSNDGSPDQTSWSTGILTKLFKKAENSSNRIVEQDKEGGGSIPITHWIVLNGFNWSHIHWLESLLNHPHRLKLSNGDLLNLPGNTVHMYIYT